MPVAACDGLAIRGEPCRSKRSLESWRMSMPARPRWLRPCCSTRVVFASAAAWTMAIRIWTRTRSSASAVSRSSRHRLCSTTVKPTSCSWMHRGMSIFLPRRSARCAPWTTRFWLWVPTMACRGIPKPCGACLRAMTSRRSSISTKSIWRIPAAMFCWHNLGNVFPRAVWMPTNCWRAAPFRRTLLRWTRRRSRSFLMRVSFLSQRCRAWLPSASSFPALLARRSRTEVWTSYSTACVL